MASTASSMSMSVITAGHFPRVSRIATETMAPEKAGPATCHVRPAMNQFEHVCEPPSQLCCGSQPTTKAKGATERSSTRLASAMRRETNDCIWSAARTSTRGTRDVVPRHGWPSGVWVFSV